MRGICSRPRRRVPWLGAVVVMAAVAPASAQYTTRGSDIVDRRTGEKVLLRGFGLGGWLLPEGYMWGIRTLDRPRQFEAAIVDLIGEADAAEFWRLYHENFVTEGDIAAMKSWGANSVRVPLLAAVLQPRQDQPKGPPYHYSAAGFAILDRLVDWCERHEIGVIWDMHGAPGAQNAENISDSDGQARLWTERETYWPMCVDLWMKIVERYKDRPCIIGYDLLNEPLLRRYEGVDAALLREFYVLLTKKIRTIDPDGIIFIEGDDWAQDFRPLEPLDWDPHLVVAFHSYPPTSSPEGLERWDRLRRKYHVPLWHGETGERGPPYAVNRLSTEFLERADVGWNWWTHKKFDRMTQPWLCPRTAGFERILDYWKGDGPRPTPAEARAALFEQARQTNSAQCVFLPEMVRSLKGLDPDRYRATEDVFTPQIVRPPAGTSVEEGGVAEFVALATGGGLTYSWLRDGQPSGAPSSVRLRLNGLLRDDDGARIVLRVSNAKGSIDSPPAVLHVRPFTGPRVPRATPPPRIDGQVDEVWEHAPRLSLDRVVLTRGSADTGLSAVARVLWDDAGLDLLVEVDDDVRFNEADISYENDGVEVFLDWDNSKSDLYGDGDYRFRYVWNTSAVQPVGGERGQDILAAQRDTESGYVMEMRFPWPALSKPAAAGRYVGLDVHVNDNDGRGRVLKRAWHARRDDAHLSPAHLGTVRLIDSR